MKSRISVLFYLKKSNINSKGEVPAQLRLTIDSKSFEMYDDRNVNPELWISGFNTVKLTNVECRVLNTLLPKVY